MPLQWEIQQTADTTLNEQDILQVAERAGGSAFSVHVNGPMVTVLGSGFAVPEGIVTAKHVISPVLIPGSGDTMPGSVIRVRGLAAEQYQSTHTRFVARDYDVAVLVSPEGTTPLAWGDSSALRSGVEVIVLAAPNTLGETFLAYAASGRVTDTATVVPDLFRYAIPVQPGSSGGPVLILNEGGQIVGINLLQERQGESVVGVGLKSNTVKAVLAGDVLTIPTPVLLPEGATGTDMLILGGAAGLALFALQRIIS